MGDHRATIKLEMTLHGKTYAHEMWINYWEDGDGVDHRVTDWFAECWRDAKARYDAAEAERYQREHAADIAASEKKELERLKAKYEAPV